MHLLKEEFRDIFDNAESWGDGVIKLLDWMYDAVAYFPKSIGTISRWFGEVAGYFDNTALPDVMKYKNPTPNPLPASDEGAKMYLIRAETTVRHLMVLLKELITNSN
jgi:hypothetical protein